MKTNCYFPGVLEEASFLSRLHAAASLICKSGAPFPVNETKTEIWKAENRNEN
jgi:hypothetical protein